MKLLFKNKKTWSKKPGFAHDYLNIKYSKGAN